MRKSFPGYYRRKTKKELSGLLNDSLIVVDANVLLSLYRYSDKSSDLLFKCLQKISDRLWIPHQVALEYLNNRLITLRTTKDTYDKIKKDIKTLKDNLKNSFQTFENETSIETGGWFKTLDETLKKINTDVETYYKKQPSRTESHDKILDRISDLFEDKVGKPYTFEELEAIYRVGEVRYACKLPPGFEDRDKSGIKKYGDFILWRQMIDKVRHDKIKKPIFFITSDKKKDWLIENENGIQARPELTNEFYEETGNDFYILTTPEFMQFIGELYNLEGMEKAVEEIKEIDKKQYSSIHGRFTTQNKNVGIGGATIRLVEANSNVILQTFSTDAYGNYKLNDIEYDMRIYRLHASKAPYGTAWSDVFNLIPGESIEINIKIFLDPNIFGSSSE